MVKYVRVFHLESAVNVYFVYFSTFFFCTLDTFHLLSCDKSSGRLAPSPIFHFPCTCVCVLVFL